VTFASWADASVRVLGLSALSESGREDFDALGEALGVWFKELEAMISADEAPAAWMGEAPLPEFGLLDHRPFALFNADSISAAVLSPKGAVLTATPAFTAAGAERLVEADVASEVAAGATATFKLVGSPDDQRNTGLIAYALATRAATWRLPAAIHEAAQQGDGRVVVLTTMIGDLQPIAQACRAYGLSGLQTRVAVETIRTGAIKDAAASLGLSYQTAREGLAAAMKRVGVERLPGLVTRLTTLAFGVLPGRPGSSDTLADIWGLSERQIAVAGLVAEGASRAQAAQLLGVSADVVKKELDSVYSLLQVKSGAGLARKIAETRAFSWLTEATAGGIGFVDDTAEPLRIVLRPDNSQVAFSDYGPVSGKPVLVVHSSMTTRIVSRKLLRALHAAGYRPIAIDRPGFGLTDPLPGDAPTDPFVAATADVERVLSLLKIQSIDVVARGGAQFVVALSHALPGRLGRVVMVNPGPPYRHSGRALGPMAVMKDAFVRNPATVRLVASFLASQLTYRRVARMMAQWTQGSAADELAVRDPEIVGDFYRSVRMFATGRYSGFINEQTAIARGSRPEAMEGGHNWIVLLGDNDMLYDPDVVLSYWRAMLPNADFRLVEGGGRFLAMTRPDLVASALSEPA
jgi:pimeloyl-ACP methyl ester carboxylesterase/DNA-binding NarL/FixJ family response regulator